MIARSIPILATIVGLLLPPSACAAITSKLIDFDDLVPAGFSLTAAWSWGAIGIDPDDNLYVVFGNQVVDTQDCAVFKYYANSGVRKCLGTVRALCRKQGTLWPGEQIPKGHSHISYLNGKMYFGTQNFHDEENWEGGRNATVDYIASLYHGGHIISIDCATDSLQDESKYFAEKCFTRGQGIIQIQTIAARNLVVGYTHPKGDILMYNPSTRRLTIDQHIESQIGKLSREMVVTPGGKIFTTYMSKVLAVLDLGTGAATRRYTTINTGNGYWNGLGQSNDGKTAYVSNEKGQMWKLDTDKETLASLGYLTPNLQAVSTGRIFCMCMGPDEKKLYGVWNEGPDNIRNVLLEYDIEAKKVTSLLDFKAAKQSGTFTGDNVSDTKGRIYFIKHNDPEPSHTYGDPPCGILQIDVRERMSPTVAKSSGRVLPGDRNQIRVVRTGKQAIIACASPDGGPVSAEMYDTHGSTVAGVESCVGSGQVQLRLSGIPAGSYVMKVRQGNRHVAAAIAVP